MTFAYERTLLRVSAIMYVILASGAVAAEKVKIAIIGGTADIGFYLADAKGWFAQEGIEVEMINFDSGARMIAPLATGEIDVGTGTVSAALYNAFDRDITLRVVADKGQNVRGMSFQGLLVRKALVDSGAVRTIADLKGRKVAFTGPGANDSAVMDEALRKVGSHFGEINAVYLGLPQQLPAYVNGAIDASIMPEPFRTNAIKSGAVTELLPVAELRDKDQIGTIVYGDPFIKKRPEVAAMVTKLYIRGVRYYNDALIDGRISGPKGEEVLNAMATYSSLKDKDVLRAIIPTAIDPDGRPNIDSLRSDLAFYKSSGLVKSEVTVDQVVDTTWIERAVRELGPYKK